MSIRVSILTAAAVLALTVAASADNDQIRAGKATLKQNCSGCHAIAATGDSPNPKSPPFREVVKRYPAEDLQESLAEGIMTGHPDMPQVELTPEEIEDVIAYLDALSIVTSDDGG